MSSIGTFGSFTQARLGIYAAQSGLSVTGNNIANINTYGYTRQKLDQSSFYAGGSDRYYAQNDVRVGNGVLCTGVSQLRDPYLDIRYRNEMSSVGAMDAKLGGLGTIQQILDEVGAGEDEFGILGAQFSDFFKQLEQLSANTGLTEYDIQVRSSAEALTKLFRSYAAKLEDAKNNAEMKLDQDVETINKILSNIRDLNSSIRKAQIHGDNALELRDQRNLLIDQLSSYMKVDVTYSNEDLGGGVIVEKLTIKLGNANPDPAVHTDEATLIDGVYGAQLSIKEFDPNGQPVPNPNLNVTVQPLTDRKGNVMKVKDGNTMKDSEAVHLGDNDLYGALQAEREMLTEAGEFTSNDVIQNVDPDAASKRGIPYYQKTLDLLARKFAETFNAANQGYVHNADGEYVDVDGKPITDAAGNVLTNKTPLTPDQENYLKTHGGQPKGGNLFSNSSDGDDATNITASNISISSSWTSGPLIVNSFVQQGNQGIASTDSSNIAHMLVLMKDKMDYRASDLMGPGYSDKVFFNGSFNDMWINTGTVLGNDMMSTSTLLDTYYSASVQLDNSRSSTSSVDLNDEAMNLMQYSKSYNAACRLMTTLDSVLDKLINNTGMTT